MLPCLIACGIGHSGLIRFAPLAPAASAFSQNAQSGIAIEPLGTMPRTLPHILAAGSLGAGLRLAPLATPKGLIGPPGTGKISEDHMTPWNSLKIEEMIVRGFSANVIMVQFETQLGNLHRPRSTRALWPE